MKNNHPTKLFIPLLFMLMNLHHTYAQNNSTLLKIYFPEGKYTLSPAAKNQLKIFTAQSQDQQPINIAGRSDRHGSDALNDSLSLQRALAVKNFLIANQFPRENIHSIIGYGRRNPVEGDSLHVDSLNRVVWITLSSSKPLTSGEVIKAVFLRDSTIQLMPPYPPAYLVGNLKPRRGDTLHIDTMMQQVSTNLYILRKIYLADDTITFSLGAKEIPEKTKAADLARAFMDTLESSIAGQAIIIRGLNFEFGYHVMPKSDLPALQAVSAALKSLPQLKLKVRGHVCCGDFGADVFDKQSGQYDLSTNRAKEVYEYLLTEGIDQSRISFSGQGMKEPIVYPEKGKNDQYKNRRIEFVIVEK